MYCCRVLVCLVLLLCTCHAQSDMSAMFAKFLEMMSTTSTTTESSTTNVSVMTTATVDNTTDTDGDNATTFLVTETPKLTVTSCCEDGWIAFGGSCYLLPRIKHRYLDAVDYCKTANAGPIVINSHEEIQIVLSNLSMSQENTWIGYSDQFKSGAIWPTWYDDQGADVTQFTWLTPSGNQGFINGAISCAAYFNLFPGSESYFHYYNCMLPFYFACERNTTATKAPATESVDVPAETEPATSTEATTTTTTTTTPTTTTTTTTPTTTTTTTTPTTTTTTTPTTTTTSTTTTPTTATTTTTPASTTTTTKTTTTTTKPTTTTATGAATTTTVDPKYAEFLAFMNMQKGQASPTVTSKPGTTAAPTTRQTSTPAYYQSLWNDEQARLRQEAIQRMYPTWG